MATASRRTYRGHDGMRPPKFHPNRSIGRRVMYLCYSVSSILQYGGRPPSWIGILPFWTTHVVNYAVRLPSQNLVSIWSSSPEILRFYNFASSAGKCLTTPPFWGFWGFEPLKITGRHPNPQKAHPWVTTRHTSHKRLKSVQGCHLGASPRKKVYPGQDRTGQDNKKVTKA